MTRQTVRNASMAILMGTTIGTLMATGCAVAHNYQRAHQACVSPQEALAHKGQATRCWKLVQDGEVVTRCMVYRREVERDGTVVYKPQVMTAFRPHCGQGQL